MYRKGERFCGESIVHPQTGLPYDVLDLRSWGISRD
jgi:hypothetical protein